MVGGTWANLSTAGKKKKLVVHRYFPIVCCCPPVSLFVINLIYLLCTSFIICLQFYPSLPYTRGLSSLLLVQFFSSLEFSLTNKGTLTNMTRRDKEKLRRF
uniref:Uncharacterized protein n=1 Tax=Cacopsylla melanoneura TaxID=428564 RepID=A0A8D8XA19_9HEMI